MPYELTNEQRHQYRLTSIRSQKRKRELLEAGPIASIGEAPLGRRLDPNDLMPQLDRNGLTCVSIFSGGGGLDLGFERAGFVHRASYEILDVCGDTLRTNRPDWTVHSGKIAGDVRAAPFSQHRGVDLVQGGPPCQPFSVAGKQAGEHDDRNMWPDFVRCIRQIRPRAFLAENVPGLLDSKFDSYIRKNILEPLEKNYTIFRFKLSSDDFGVPQSRRRVFFVGFRAKRDAARFVIPAATHGISDMLGKHLLPRNTVRSSLGLPDIGIDDVSPTLRSGFTGPRNTTGVVNSLASMKRWDELRIWPNGVQPTREMASTFRPENGNFRLSVADCALLQGFPESWKFSGAVYQALGQIGNSVCPPVAYQVARHIAAALLDQ